MAFVSDKPSSGFERRTRFDSAIDQIGGALIADGFSREVLLPNPPWSPVEGKSCVNLPQISSTLFVNRRCS